MRWEGKVAIKVRAEVEFEVELEGGGRSGRT
jgi:hypothetical protein